MKKLLALVMVFGLAAAVVGCGSSSSTAPTTKGSGK